jgi:hypothetical protein
MDIDQEIKNLIEEYVKKIEDKEEELTLFKKEIDSIISESKKELQQVTTDLEVKFNANEINEEEYLISFRKSKEDILKRAKEKMDVLIAECEKKYSN